MAYIGSNDKARRIKSVYIGVNNVARKVTTGYVGVDNAARKWWGTQGTTDPDIPVNPPAETKTDRLDNSWYRTSYPKENITKIAFYTGDNVHPLEGTYDERWNADSDNSGGIYAYRTGSEIKVIKNMDEYIYDYFLSPNCSAMFSGFNSLNTVNLTALNTRYVTDMAYMFYNCSSLTFIELEGWRTADVISMREMFSGCSSLSRIEVTEPYTLGDYTYGWVTANADTTDMFKNCGCSGVIYV